jgi:TonB family protein
MKKYIWLFLIFASFNVQAQVYDYENFLEIKNKTSFRTELKVVGSLFVKKIFYDNDTLCQVIHFSDYAKQKKEGKIYEYYKSGKLKYEISYQNDMLNGPVTGYFENGNIRRQDIYNNDVLVEGKCFTEDGRDTTYYIFKKKATFGKANLEVFHTYAMVNVQYPGDAAEENISGTVVLSFVINTDGNIEDIQVVKSPDWRLTKAVKDVILKGGKWEPAIYEGKTVKQRITMPIIFNLS